MSLDDAIDAYRNHVVALHARIDPRELLRKRPLAMYWSLGVRTAGDLAAMLVDDRSVASREMALGYLYERVLEEACGARKLTNAEKREWRGVDFRKETGREVLLINLKSSRGTSNADIGSATKRNLAAARAHEVELQSARNARGDDNPLTAGPPAIRAVSAIARGKAHRATRTQDGQEIEVLVGDRLWEALGAGAGFGLKIQQALGKTPIDKAALLASRDDAVTRVVQELVRSGCVGTDGAIDWECLLVKYPDV